MFIVWGRKIVYRNVGYVADFCPICRTVQPFGIRRVGSAGHVYYISAGEGELVGFERTCRQCGTSLQAEPATYASVSKTLVPLAELVRQTYPNVEQVLHDRLALEQRVLHSPSSLSQDERHALIRSPFVLLSPKVERRFSSTHIDKEVGFSVLGAIALLVVGPAVAHSVAPDSTDLAALIFIGLGVVVVAWQAALSGRRFMRREVIPVLANSLRPLRPTETELRSVLAELKQLRHKMATKLVLADLQVQIGDASRAA